MPSNSSAAQALAAATCAALTQHLEAFRAECKEAERPFVDVLLHMLTDPIEQMRLRAPTDAYFSEEEEQILREMEGADRR
jgi:hypothetical protein